MSNTLYVWGFAIASSVGLLNVFSFTPNPETPPDAGWVLRGVQPQAELVAVESVNCLGTMPRSFLGSVAPHPDALKFAVKPRPA